MENYKSKEYLLKDDFEGISLIRSETGNLTVDISSLPNVNVTVITSGDSNIVKQVSAEEQTNSPNIVQHTPTKAAFDSQDSAVKVGLVQLNKVSKYLIDLPDEAQAEFLISPKNIALLFKCNLDKPTKDTENIRSISEDDGLHYKGKAIKGMQIFDCTKDTPEVTYEEAWATKVRQAWEQAKNSGQDVTTGWAIGTKELVHGCKADSCYITVASNMYSEIGNINSMLAQQGGEEIITDPDSGNASFQLTSTTSTFCQPGVYVVNFTNSTKNYSNNGEPSLRLVALHVLAPKS